MAIRYATKAGNWSDTTVWDGGTLPASTDDVYSNNFSVTIDQDITVNSLKRITNGSPSIAAGGSFLVASTRAVTLTAGIVSADNATAGNLITLNAGASLTLNGNVASTGLSTSYMIATGAANATLTVNGNVTGANATGRMAIRAGHSTTTITINGNITGGTYAIELASTANSLTISGSITANSTTPPIAVTSGSATITVGGSVSAAAQANGVCLSLSGSASVVLDADLTGGSLGGASPVTVASACSLTYRGTATAGALSSAVSVTAGGIVRVSGDLYHSTTGTQPIAGPFTVIAGEEVRLHLYNDASFPSGNGGAAVVLSVLGSDLPEPGDVRMSTTYGPGGGSVGTLAVPAADSVAAGVPIDDGVGTAALSQSALITATGAQIAAALNSVS